MASSRRGALHFIIEVHGKDSQGKDTLVTLSHHASLHSAFGGLVGVLQQWEASHGAIPVGTAVKLKDTRDGGTVWAMQYLGFEQDTLIGRNAL